MLSETPLIVALHPAVSSAPPSDSNRVQDKFFRPQWRAG